MAVVERLFWQLGTHFSGRCRCRKVAVVERFKQEVMYGLSAGTKKSGRCREVAVSGGSTVLELKTNPYLSQTWYRTQNFLNGVAPKLSFCGGHTFFNFINILLDSIYKGLHLPQETKLLIC